MKSIKLFICVLAALFLAESSVHAARVVMRITKWSSDGILQQYQNNPGTYPVTQEKLSCIGFKGAPDDCVRPNGTRIFDTTRAVHASFYGENSDGSFTGNEVVKELRKYEDVGLTVDVLFIYREDWLHRDTGGGPFEEDPRILSPQDLINVRSAIANSNLECKDTVQLIQLLRGRGSWNKIKDDPTIMAHLLNFEGLGLEFHVGDYSKADGIERLDDMALITKWTQDNNKIGFIFTGGTPATYELGARARATYNALWSRMTALGVDKKSDHLVYFRQGARSGVHVTEADESLSAQMAWLIGQVWTPYTVGPDPEPEIGPTSGLVAHWPLDEGSGTQTGNAAGTSYRATLENGATWGSDATRDSYVSFDGTDDRISTTFTYALADTNDFTWAWWANKQVPAGQKEGSIMVGSRYGNSGAEDYEFIKFTPISVQFADTSNTDNIERFDYADIPQNEWHHYAMVKDGTSYQWYVDGVAQGSSSNLVYNETTPIPFRIGGDIDGKPNECFQGFIDDVVLYRDALTQQGVSNVINGIYLPFVSLTTLGTAVDSTDGSAWSDGQPAHSGAAYIIPNTGHLRGEGGTTTFPGASLKVEAGGKFQVRSTGGDVTTVNDLILEGGTSFDPGAFVELTAGTGTDEINVLDGTITQSGATRLVTYGGSIARSLKILSEIDGDGTLQVVGEAAFVDYAENTFSGLWQVDDGARLQFSSAGAVGTADIEVLSGGKLQIQGHWNRDAELIVADTATTSVDLQTYSWTVSNLTFGTSSVAEGLYSAAELNALGANAVFTGLGTLRVGERNPNEPIAHWKLDEASGTVATDSSGSGYTGTIINGATWGSDATRDSYVSFDGSNDRITTPFTYALADTDNFTWAWWANSAVPSTDTKQAGSVMVGNRHPERTETKYGFIKFTPQGTQLANCEEAGDIEHYDYTEVPQGGWHHYAMVKSGTSFQWYVDGVAQGAPVTINYNETDPIPFLIGGDDDGSGTKVNEHFQGFIDDVVLYDRALSASEVLNMYGAVPIIPPELQIGMSGGDMVFDWTGTGFKVQSRTNLMEGIWVDVPGGDTPPVTNSTTEGEAFFRLIEQ